MLFQIFAIRRHTNLPPCSNVVQTPIQSWSNPCPPPLPACAPLSAAPQGVLHAQPAVPELGRPAGMNHASAAEAASFSNRCTQGQSFSTKLSQVYSDTSYRFVEEKHFNLSYKSGTPQLTEVQKDESLVASRFEVMFFADGKIYNAKGQVQGRLLLEGPPVAGQDKSSLLFTRGTLENSVNGTREEYNPACMTLGGRKVFIVNGAPPDTEAVYRPVAGTELESREGSNGLILHTPKVVGYEIEWVSRARASELKKERVESLREELSRLNLTSENKIGTLSDGSRVSCESGKYFAHRETVLPAKHPLGRSEVVFGKTGVSHREHIGDVMAPEKKAEPPRMPPVSPLRAELLSPPAPPRPAPAPVAPSLPPVPKLELPDFPDPVTNPSALGSPQVAKKPKEGASGATSKFDVTSRSAGNAKAVDDILPAKAPSERPPVVLQSAPPSELPTVKKEEKVGATAKSNEPAKSNDPDFSKGMMSFLITQDKGLTNEQLKLIAEHLTKKYKLHHPLNLGKYDENLQISPTDEFNEKVLEIRDDLFRQAREMKGGKVEHTRFAGGAESIVFEPDGPKRFSITIWGSKGGLHIRRNDGLDRATGFTVPLFGVSGGN